MWLLEGTERGNEWHCRRVRADYRKVLLFSLFSTVLPSCSQEENQGQDSLTSVGGRDFREIRLNGFCVLMGSRRLFGSGWKLVVKLEK